MSRNSSRGQFLIFGDGPSKGGTVLNFLYSGGTVTRFRHWMDGSQLSVLRGWFSGLDIERTAPGSKPRGLTFPELSLI